MKYKGAMKSDLSYAYSLHENQDHYVYYYQDNNDSQDSSSSSLSSDDSMRADQPEQAFCTQDYDGDEACICETIKNFENDAGRGFLNLGESFCVYDTPLCYYSNLEECTHELKNDRTHEPWRETNSTRHITVNEVCGENTCFVNGCGDMSSDDFWQYGAPSILVVVSLS